MKKSFFVALVLLLQCHVYLGATKVAVIGAGLAGLTTAYRLQKAGYDVEVFEARERVGGRVFTVSINGSFEELGGQNINDGGDGTNIVALATELGLAIDADERLSANYLYEEATGKAFNFYKELMPDFPPLTPQRREELKHLEAKSANMQEVLDGFLSKTPRLKQMFSSWMRSYEGSETNRLSAFYTQGSFLWMLENAENNYARFQKKEAIVYKNRSIKGGNARLTQEISKRLGKNVHLGMPLIGLSKSEASGYELCFRNRSAAHADLVVLSVPASVLTDIEFKSKTIPTPVLEKMHALSYGTIAKILMPVKTTKEMFGSVNSDFSGAWFSKDKKVITLYMTGDAGEIRTPADFAKTYQRATKGVVAAYPGIVIPVSPSFKAPRDEQFSSFIAPVGLSWAVEPYTRGGYSNYSPAQYAMRKKTIQVDGEHLIELFAPIDDAIFFAGEHTAVENPSTMEGAVESGESAARLVAKRLRAIDEARCR